MRKTVYFVSLSRSDYASLRPVVRSVLQDGSLEVKLVVGGSHLLARFGNTIMQIKRDGLPIHEVAEFLSETDSKPAELAKAYGKAVNEFVRIFSEGKPDYVFVVGDRWEMLAVVSAASMLQIPIMHHSGGDITQGSADNQTRYAISCLAHLHLVALPEHRERLIRMGEESWRVITTGEPALTELEHYADGKEAHRTLGLKPGEPFVLATFHPTSFDTLSPEQQIDTFLKALDIIPDRIILTAPNPDAASELFFRKLKAYAEKHANIHFHESLGAETYYAAMSEARYMIGNSSSGLWEAPSFKLPVVNIGPRQQGRMHGGNVVHAPLGLPEISAAIHQVSDPAFREKLTGDNPYVRPDTLDLILDCLKQPHDRAKLLFKHFVDPLHG